jgi:hypothetical protein
VLRTLAGQETDRVPLYDLLLCDAAFVHFSGQALPPLAGDAQTRAKLHEIAARANGNFLDMTRNVGFGPIVEGDSTDAFGFVWHTSPAEKTSWVARRPFDDEKGAIEFLKKWTADQRRSAKAIAGNPAGHRERYHRNFLRTQSFLGETVNLLAVHGVGLDDVRHRLGMELFAYVQAEDGGAISEAMEATTECNIAECHAVADLELSPAVLTYGDIACKERLLHSPQYLRRDFFPLLKRLNDAWHEHGFKCLFHSDGNLMEAMDDLVAAGIDGLNPIETVAGMNLKEVRRKYPRLFLAGGIDMSQLLSHGKPEQVRDVCRQAIRDACPRYFMGSTTELDNSSKLENLLAMYEVAMEGLPPPHRPQGVRQNSLGKRQLTGEE